MLLVKKGVKQMAWAQNTYFINGPLPAHTFTRDEIDTFKYEKTHLQIKLW